MQQINLLHTTKSPNNPNKTLEASFLVTNENGQSQIVHAFIPSAADLYNVCNQKEWVTGGGSRESGTSTIRDLQRR